ncbi:MAG: hypothetical protein AAF468_15665 [Pseudomonadota bacterium]
MKIHLSIAVLLSLTANLAGPQNAVGQSIAVDRIVSVATGDWNKDGEPDTAMLVAPPQDGDDMGVMFLLGERYTGRQVMHSFAPSKIWGNVVTAGQVPKVVALKNGSIAVTSENAAIGRNRWQQQLTIAFRDNRFVVAGFTHSYYDTLNNDDIGNCDLNMLSGRGKVNDKAVRFKRSSVELTNWKDSLGISVCGFY